MDGWKAHITAARQICQCPIEHLEDLEESICPLEWLPSILPSWILDHLIRRSGPADTTTVLMSSPELEFLLPCTTIPGAVFLAMRHDATTQRTAVPRGEEGKCATTTWRKGSTWEAAVQSLASRLESMSTICQVYLFNLCTVPHNLTPDTCTLVLDLRVGYLCRENVPVYSWCVECRLMPAGLVAWHKHRAVDCFGHQVGIEWARRPLYAVS